MLDTLGELPDPAAHISIDAVLPDVEEENDELGYLLYAPRSCLVKPPQTQHCHTNTTLPQKTVQPSTFHRPRSPPIFVDSVDQRLIDVARGLVAPFGRTLAHDPSTVFGAVAEGLNGLLVGIHSSSELLRTAAAQAIAHAVSDNTFLLAQRFVFANATGFDFTTYKPGPTITGSPVDAALIALVLKETNLRLAVCDVSCDPPAVHFYLPIGTHSSLVPKVLASESDIDHSDVVVVRFGPKLPWLSAPPRADGSSRSGSSDSAGSSSDSESGSSDSTDSESNSADSESDSTDSESPAGPLNINVAEIEIGDIGIGDIIDARSPELPTTWLQSSVATEVTAEEHESRRPAARRRNSRSETGEETFVRNLQAALARAKAKLTALSRSPDRRDTFKRKSAPLSFSYSRCCVSHCTTITMCSSESSSDSSHRSFTDGELLLKRYNFLFLFVFVKSVLLGASSFVEAWPYGQYLPRLDIEVEGEPDSGDGLAVLAAFAGKIAEWLSPLNLQLHRHRGPNAAQDAHDSSSDSDSSSADSSSGSSSGARSLPNPNALPIQNPTTTGSVRVPRNPRSVTMHQKMRTKLCTHMHDLANFPGTIKSMALVGCKHHQNRTEFSFERVSTKMRTTTTDTELFRDCDVHRLAAILHKCSSVDPADPAGKRLVLSPAEWNELSKFARVPHRRKAPAPRRLNPRPRSSHGRTHLQRRHPPQSRLLP